MAACVIEAAKMCGVEVVERFPVRGNEQEDGRWRFAFLAGN